MGELCDGAGSGSVPVHPESISAIKIAGRTSMRVGGFIERTTVRGLVLRTRIGARVRVARMISRSEMSGPCWSMGVGFSTADAVPLQVSILVILSQPVVSDVESTEQRGEHDGRLSDTNRGYSIMRGGTLTGVHPEV
jgi:hypothetical protein